MHSLSCRTVASLLLVLSLAGCAGIGPNTVARDRFDYITALSDSWKSQMLLNTVKQRYGDSPVFLEVASIINQYAVEGTVDLRASWFTNPFSTSQFLGAQGKYTDRPTITYSPLTGERLARTLMTPIPITAILSLIQAGYPIDLVLRVAAHSINGIRNRYGGEVRARNADPEFYPLLDRLRRIQNAGEKNRQRGSGGVLLPAEGGSGD